jgi:FixJ family two-component response regulator
VRELLCALCESAGLEAEAYDSAQSFLNAYAYEPIKARCLVLDCNLPGMSGLDLLDKLNAQGIRLSVLLIDTPDITFQRSSTLDGPTRL